MARWGEIMDRMGEVATRIVWEVTSRTMDGIPIVIVAVIVESRDIGRENVRHYELTMRYGSLGELR